MFPDQSLTDFERSDMTGHWSWGLSVIYIMICGLKFVVYTFTHRQYTMATEIWNLNCFVRAVINLNCGSWNVCILELHKAWTPYVCMWHTDRQTVEREYVSLSSLARDLRTKIMKNGHQNVILSRWWDFEWVLLSSF